MAGAVNQNNLGAKVKTRDISWHDLCARAWGSEFLAPDHNVYQFSNNRGFDSTDRSHGGPYSPTHP